jgi:general L-amino acid transport system permease protein
MNGTMDQSQNAEVEELKPPIISKGVIGWIKINLFSNVFNSILSIAVLYFLWKVVPPLFRWAFIDSLLFSTAKECQTCKGACWSVITKNIRFILFGFYPHELQWRPLLAMVIMIGLIVFTWDRRHWKKPLAYFWVAGIICMGVLMSGGVLGLDAVEITKWSGLPLTFMLAIFGMAVAYPLGVLLALGRRSKMPAVKILSIAYIEIIRGMPLITLLFMSVVMFPLFMPKWISINKIINAQVALIMFTSAYISEVVRGGLQGISLRQHEAAQSLGLNYYQTMLLVILPQALKIVIPPTVSILITAFKDTSLLAIIALYDLLKTTESVLSIPEWMEFSSEAYIFIAIIYFLCCFVMSEYSRKLDKELSTGS